eukprot:TRINITY_DN39752_c0_g1_i1.p2 TRINITY_DN39752_c0_g1~~TRINITY_DN39752_c0_g1_i1.p2  ORF type:complete len:181 (+),score=4.13 TRINITY_DN39752_c0_g1_i1:54-596(+)
MSLRFDLVDNSHVNDAHLCHSRQKGKATNDAVGIAGVFEGTRVASQFIELEQRAKPKLLKAQPPVEHGDTEQDACCTTSSELTLFSGTKNACSMLAEPICGRRPHNKRLSSLGQPMAPHCPPAPGQIETPLVGPSFCCRVPGACNSRLLLVQSQRGQFALVMHALSGWVTASLGQLVLIH